MEQHDDISPVLSVYILTAAGIAIFTPAALHRTCSTAPFTALGFQTFDRPLPSRPSNLETDVLHIAQRDIRSPASEAASRLATGQAADKIGRQLYHRRLGFHVSDSWGQASGCVLKAWPYPDTGHFWPALSNFPHFNLSLESRPVSSRLGGDDAGTLAKP